MTPISIPLRTGRGQNDRYANFGQRARIVKAERLAVAWALAAAQVNRPPLPCVVTLTRRAPSNGLDDDTLAGALKGVRDQFADWIGIDDKRRDLVRYEYAQERGLWAVRIAWTPMVDQALALLSDAGSS